MLVALLPNRLTEVDLERRISVPLEMSHACRDQRPSEVVFRNHILSILFDARGVVDVVQALGNPPVVANERCGSWYVRPEIKKGSVYFKSTDGHTGQWSFSTRRLNLSILRLLGEHSV